MYQFTTTNVINSAYALDYNGNILVDGNGSQIAKYAGSATALNVAKIGTFKKANIVSIYKRPYAAGVKEIAKVTVGSGTAGDVFRLTVVLKQEQVTPSDFVNYTLDFQKPITVEVLYTTDAATTAGLLKDQINLLKDRFGQSYITATVNSAEITLTAKENSLRFKSVSVDLVEADTNSLAQYKLTNKGTGSVTTAGKLGFGDDAWMIKTLYIPTAENVRYFGISRDERPIAGGNYTEYVLRYSVTKDGTDGIVAGGTSVTTHVFYVKSDLVAGFDSAIAAVGLTTTGPLSVTATGDVTTLDTSDNATVQLIVTGNVGPVTYASSQVTYATVNATGLVTTAGVTGTGDTVITVTDSVGNTDTITITVVA